MRLRVADKCGQSLDLPVASACLSMAPDNTASGGAALVNAPWMGRNGSVILGGSFASGAGACGRTPSYDLWSLQDAGNGPTWTNAPLALTATSFAPAVNGAHETLGFVDSSGTNFVEVGEDGPAGRMAVTWSRRVRASRSPTTPRATVWAIARAPAYCPLLDDIVGMSFVDTDFIQLRTRYTHAQDTVQTDGGVRHPVQGERPACCRCWRPCCR